MKDNGPVSNFLAGVEEELNSSAEDRRGIGTWGPVFRPEETPEEAGAPLEAFAKPLWSRSHGWIDRSELAHEPMVWTDPSEIE